MLDARVASGETVRAGWFQTGRTDDVRGGVEAEARLRRLERVGGGVIL
jgi:hypothetical protein